MKADIIKKENTYLLSNNLALTYYEILGNDDIYFLKLKIKNNSKHVKSFTVNYIVLGKQYSFDVKCDIKENEEKEVLDVINISDADFEFISFSNIEYVNETKEEIEDIKIDKTIKTKRKNLNLLLTISSIIVSLIFTLSRLIFPFINKYSKDESKILNYKYKNDNIFKFFFKSHYNYYDEYKYVYLFKFVIVLLGLFLVSFFIYQLISNYKKDKLKLIDLKYPVFISYLIYLLSSNSFYSFDIIIFTILLIGANTFIDFFYYNVMESFNIKNKIFKSIMMAFIILLVLFYRQPIIDNMDIYKLFYNSYQVYDGSVRILSLILIIFNLIIIIYLTLFIVSVITDKIKIAEYLLIIILSIIYSIYTFIVSISKSFDKTELSSVFIIIISIFIIITLIINKFINNEEKDNA